MAVSDAVPLPQSQVVIFFIMRYFNVIGAIIVIASGYIGYTSEDSYLHGIRVSPFADLLLIVIGLVYLINTLIKWKQKESDDYFICVNCKEPILRTLSKNNICQTCGKKLEELKGFYERHKELKEG